MTAGAMLVLCIFGLLIFAGVEVVHALYPEQNAGGGTVNSTSISDVTYKYSFLDDVMERLGVVTDVRMLPDIEYIIGDINLVMAAPHGGYKRPKYIPDRTTGCLVAGKCLYRNECEPKDYESCNGTVEHDDVSRELTFLISHEIYQLLGKSPHLVINNLDRAKLDPNRERKEATFGDPYSIFGWRKYHKSIEQAKSTFDGPGLFLDIHGHGHAIQRTELGYQILGDDLDDGNLDPSISSIRSLAGRVKIPFEDLIRGPKSFGGMFVKRGYRAVPSPDELGPGGEKYFYGLYDTLVHGSLYNGSVDGIMVESAQAYRKPDVIQTYAKDFASTVVEYMQLYYNLQVPDDSPFYKTHQKAIQSSEDGAQKYVSNNVDTLESTEKIRNNAGDIKEKTKSTKNSIGSQQTKQDTGLLEMKETSLHATGSEIKTENLTQKDEYEKFHRFPVLLSAGLFATFLSLVMIGGYIFWKRRRANGYMSLNGGEYILFDM